MVFMLPFARTFRCIAQRMSVRYSRPTKHSSIVFPGQNPQITMEETIEKSKRMKERDKNLGKTNATRLAFI